MSEDAARSRRIALLNFVALTCMFLGTSVMNTAEFPRFDAVEPLAREVHIAATTVALFVIALVHTFKPQLIHARTINLAAFAVMAAGIALVEGGLAADSVPLLLAGLCALGAAKAWVTLVVGLACSVMGLRTIALCTFGALLASRVAAVALPTVPAADLVGVVLFYGLTYLSWALVVRIPRGIFAHARTAEPPADLAIANPSSFLPFASQVFVCIFIMQTAFGFSLRSGAVEGGALMNVLGVAPLLVALAWVALDRRRFAADLFTELCIVIVVAGFLLALVPGRLFVGVGNVLISSGSMLFDAVIWTLLISLASRNELGAISVISWGRGLGGLGSITGAGIGRFAADASGQDATLLALVMSGVIVAVVAYALIGLRRFSFEEAIAGTRPVAEGAPNTSAEAFATRCVELCGAYALTPRESEVFELLARGRNQVYIQEKLVVSRDTVKAHVKHIYAKLDIHSRQELIDLIEHDAAPEANL